MSELPGGWKTRTLAGICSLITDGSHYSPASAADGFPYVTVRDLDGGSIDLNHCKRIAGNDFQDLARNGCQPVPGDVLFSKDGTVGKVAVVRGDADFVVLSSLAILRPNQGLVTPEYLAHGLRSPALVRQALRGKTGTAIRRVVLRTLRELTLPLPPLDEQRRIVAILEDHLSRLDAAETAARGGLRRTAALRRAHLAEAFADGTDELRPLLDVASIANGQTPRGLVERLSTQQDVNTVPFFKVGDMNAADGRWMNDARFFVSRQSAEELGLHVRPAGTVLIPKRGGAIATNKKRILFTPAAYDLNTMGLIPTRALDSSYLWYWLQTIDLGRIADGSNVPQINSTQIRELRLPVPDIQIQRRLSARLDGIDEGLVRLSAQVESVCVRAAVLRRSLLTAAFSGHLTGTALAASVGATPPTP